MYIFLVLEYCFSVRLYKLHCGGFVQVDDAIKNVAGSRCAKVRG